MQRTWRTAVLAVGVLTLFACGGSSNSIAANPCATKGATYLATSTEVSGNCGPVASQVVNVNPDGTITSRAAKRAGARSVQGCTRQQEQLHLDVAGL